MMGGHTILRNVFFILLITIIVLYAGFELRSFIIGPTLTVTTPQSGNTLPSSITTVSGTATRISFLYLNGRQIYTNESGFFEETVLLPKGYNVLTIEAIGRFNKKIVRTLTVLSP